MNLWTALGGLTILLLGGCGSGGTVPEVLPKGEARAHLRVVKGDAYEQVDRWEVPADLEPQNTRVAFEGPTLENDVIGFRFYADARHRSDVFGKRVADIVLDTVGWDYHDVGDWGADVLKVGDALGVGAPAVLYEGQLYPFGEASAKTIEVVRDGGDTAAFRFRWEGLDVAGARVDVEQDWWMTPGTYWAGVDLRVTGGALPAGAQLATGIVRHDTAGAPAVGTTAAGCAYVATWGPQSYHGDDLGLAVVGHSAAEYVELPGGGPAAAHSHVLAFAGEGAARGASYRMVAAWGRGHAGLSGAAAFARVVTGACGR